MNLIKQTAEAIANAFENFLEDRNVVIPNAEREQDANAAAIYGTQYGDLVDAISEHIRQEAVFTADPIRMGIDAFLYSKPKKTALREYLDYLELDLDTACGAWRMHWSLARSIMMEFRSLIADIYKLSATEDDNLKHEIMDLIAGHMCDCWLRCCYKDLVDFCETDNPTIAQMEGFLKILNEQMCRYRNTEEEQCAFYLVSCVNRELSISRYETRQGAHMAMKRAMAEKGGIDAAKIEDTSEFSCDEYAFSYATAWGWTSHNCSEHAKCAWQIIPLHRLYNGALVAIWEKQELTVKHFGSLAEARNAMRSMVYTRCNEDEQILLNELAAYSGDHFSFDDHSASLTTSYGVKNWRVFSLGNNRRSDSYSVWTTLKQELFISTKELVEINEMVENYSPDMDTIRTKQFLLPYMWEKDFGGGWSVSIDVVEPYENGKSMDAYCEAVLYRHGEIVHRSVRDSKVDGIWGLRYDNYLFQVEVKAV